MKISRVEPMLFPWGSLYVRIWTDEGLYGLGECSPMGSRREILTCLEQLAPLLLGRDPRQRDPLLRGLLHRFLKLGDSGILPEALAGLDIALWDLLGKLSGQPLYVLLGGAYRTSFPLYASIGGGAGLTVAQMVERVESFRAQGFQAFKIRMDWGAHRRDADPEKDFAMFRACRQALGDAVPLSFDANNGYSVKTAIRQGRRMAELGLAHFEEPVAPYDYPGLRAVAEALDVPVSAGEHEYTAWRFRELIAEAQVPILQPDVVKCCGISEMRRIIALAEAHNLDLLPHQTQPQVGLAASLHLCATTPLAMPYHEYTGRQPRQEELFEEPLVPDANGVIHLPERPGLGLVLREEAVRRALAG